MLNLESVRSRNTQKGGAINGDLADLLEEVKWLRILCGAFCPNGPFCTKCDQWGASWQDGKKCCRPGCSGRYEKLTRDQAIMRSVKKLQTKQQVEDKSDGC